MRDEIIWTSTVYSECHRKYQLLEKKKTTPQNKAAQASVQMFSIKHGFKIKKKKNWTYTPSSYG